MRRTTGELPAIEVIKGKLYWYSSDKPPSSQSSAYFFNVDNELVYEPFNKDFGPLNLAKTHKYMRELVRLLSDPKYSESKIFHYTSTRFDKQANSCFLMGAFMVVVLKMCAEDAWDTFLPYQQLIRPFRDASYGDCYYDCTVFHCLKGLELAVMHGWYNFRTFDPQEYEYYEKVQNGDLNWTVPGKFISFMGPVDTKYNRRGNCPEDYIQIFKHLGVSHVVRLNDVKYDRTRFLKHGIKHTDLFFIDGSTPSDKIVNEFLRISE